MAGGPVGAAAGAALTAGIGMGARNLSAKALMNPRFAEWVAQGSKIKTAIASPVAKKHIAKLSQIAAKDPTIRNEVIQLQQRLTDALNENASIGSRVAAEEKERSEERRVGKECVSKCRSRWSPYS